MHGPGCDSGGQLHYVNMLGAVAAVQDRCRPCMKSTTLLRYLAAMILPISVPITSPEITISTRRFSCRPFAVSLEAVG